MMQSRVKDWFGERFYELHPLLQQLHENGGCLNGYVIVKYPIGFKGVVGRAIAKKWESLLAMHLKLLRCQLNIKKMGFIGIDVLTRRVFCLLCFILSKQSVMGTGWNQQVC